MITFVFETLSKDNLLLNCDSCTDVVSSGIKRFTVSPVASSLIRCWKVNFQHRMNTATKLSCVFTIPETGSYIIPLGVAHSPHDWTGPDTFDENSSTLAFKNLFYHLSDEYLRDLRSGRAFLMIDQTHEGYQTSWLWDWFFKSCAHFNISLSQIIYLTGNMDCSNQYASWADATGNNQNKMLVIPHAHFENVIYEISEGYSHPHALPPGLATKRQLPNMDYHLTYKNDNLENIKMFNVLQKRPRVHRMWFFKYLVDAELIENNIISMNEFNYQLTYFNDRVMDREDYDRLAKLLPLAPTDNPANYNKDNFTSGEGGIYILSLNDQTMLDSWCTVVSEASYGKSELSCFLSEKTFKPIACSHPFIIVGSKGSLANLRKMGYKTFSPYIDESYDDLEDWDRLEAITKEMVRLNQMTHTERVIWFKSLADILNYNYNMLASNYKKHVPDLIETFNNHIKYVQQTNNGNQ